MELFFGIMVGLILLIFLVVAHEFGHALMARRCGVIVDEFGIGLPPRAWKKKLKNGILLSLNWLPIGGFVKLRGEYDAAKKKGEYGAATFTQKSKILLAGVVVNWIVAAILLSLLALTGLPKALPDQITVPGDTVIVSSPVVIASLTKDFPAEKAGFQLGDEIIQFADQSVPTVDLLSEIIKQNIGKEVTVTYKRGGIESNLLVALKNDANAEIFGAGLGQRELIKATWSAPFVGVATTAQFTWVTIQGLGELIGNLFTFKSVDENVAGPIMIVGTIFPAAQQAGLTYLIFLTAVISLSLAVMNILPVPALDGGRWFTMVLFRLIKKKLTKEREEKIQLVGFSVLMGMVILVTIADVAKLF